MSKPKLPPLSEALALAEQADCRVSITDLARMHKHCEFSEVVVDALWPDASPRVKAIYQDLGVYVGGHCGNCDGQLRRVSSRDCVRCAAMRCRAYFDQNKTAIAQQKLNYSRANRDYINTYKRAKYQMDAEQQRAKQRARYAARKQEQAA